MNELDFGCRCPGASRDYVECNNAATQEDGLCDNCRSRDCPNSPLGWFMRETDKVMGIRVDSDGNPTGGFDRDRMDEIHDEYMRRCKEQGVQP